MNSFRILLILLSTFASGAESFRHPDGITGADDGGGEKCNICGDDGMVVTKPDEPVPNYYTTKTTTAITCGQLQAAAEAGVLPVKTCGQPLVDIVFGPCGCESSPEVSATTCNICGKGYVVTKPDASGIIPDHADATCGHFQAAAESSNGFSATTCALLPDLVFGPCGCEPVPLSIKSNTIIATPTTTTQPCSVCGEGKQVTKPHYPLVFTGDDDLYGQRVSSCQSLQRAGYNAEFGEAYCKGLQLKITVACGCAFIG